MPYIIVDLQGKASNGGYLKIDGGGQIALGDDMLIQVDPGTHYLEFSSKSTAERSINNLNAAVGNYRTAAWGERNAIDGKITEHFDEKSVMLFTVVSDASGHILDLPKYSVQEVTDEKYAELDQEYRSRVLAHNEHVKDTVGTELLLCLFLGGFGVHKFYRGKIGMGLVYLFTGGLFGIGWLIDVISLLKKYIQYKKSR